MDVAELMFNWLLEMFQKLGDLTNFITTPMQYIGVTPLYLFTLSSLGVLLGVHLIRLFVGG